MANVVNLAPQPGPQTDFLASQADIAIYGGAAGGGKTYALLLDPLRHYANADFGGIIFRRTSVQVRNEGGAWDESMKIYPLFKAHPRESTLEWRFPSRMSLGFGALEYEKDVLNWQGAQIAWIGFDELTHFSENQFFYMMSRNRTMSGVKPRIRATTNPDPDSWVRKFIDWWIDKDGYAIKERSGKLRWFVRRDDALFWANTPDEIYEEFGRGPEVIPKSVTFIAAKVEDNKILMEKNPEYLGNLLALNRVDRLRLHGGNWNVRAAAGTFFNRDWFNIIESIPAGWVQSVRYWDRAATKPSETNKDPDWTRGLRLLKYPDGRMLVADLKSLQDTPGKVDQLIKTVASHDGYHTPIVGEQDPGSAGVSDAENFVRMLQGYIVDVRKVSVNKAIRAKPASSAVQNGDVFVLRAPWNDAFFAELEAFSDNPDEYNHDDIVDVFSGAFNELSNSGVSTVDVT